MKGPSTNWQEKVAADEESRYARYAEILSSLQKERSAKFGPGRALHRKQLAGIAGEFEVLPKLPAHAQHGLFKTPGKYPATVRLSNGDLNIQSDKLPDIRGFAIKVRGIEGQGALGGTAKAQDFLLINHELFGIKDSEAFVGLVQATAKGPLGLLQHFFSQNGLLGGIREITRTVKKIGKPFTGFASESFFSALPIACGPYAARVRLLPASREINAEASKDWGADIKRRLQSGPLSFEMQLQFYVDEKTTPIEDGCVNWEESNSPYVTVGHLRLPKQEFDSEKAKALAQSVERDSFDPWGGLMDHRPLGDIMRARKTTYFVSQNNRKN